MCLKLTCISRIDCCQYEMFLCKPHNNHKTKSCSKYTKDKETGIKAYQYRKIIKPQKGRSREEETNKEIIKQP